jgi:hypothetical protein
MRRKGTTSPNKGWLSAHGRYNPIGTPELDLVPEEEKRLPWMINPVNRDSDAAPEVALPDRVVDHHAKAYNSLRSEIRRSTRAIPACMAGQDLQDVLANPALHTQKILTLPQINSRAKSSKLAGDDASASTR